MSRHTIGDIAERSGFSPSALRYYDELGLVEPTARSERGYRLYDDAVLTRLAFIARAKQLGCSLEEIADLVGVWDGQRCGPLQHRFHDLVMAKIRATERQTVELATLSGQLRQAAAQLAGEVPDGPCGGGCACVSATPTSDATATSHVEVGSEPTDVPIACTLETSAMPDRRAQWAALLATARRRVAFGETGMKIEFGQAVDLADLARLVAAEQRCCAFFSFAMTVDARGIALEVVAPDGAVDLVADLFGTSGWTSAGIVAERRSQHTVDLADAVGTSSGRMPSSHASTTPLSGSS